VLVVGAGPIGVGAALFARLAGAEVTLYDRDADRAGTVAAISGATALPFGQDPAREYDVVFDATGNARAMESGFDHVANGGRYVLVSIVTETIAFRDPDFHRKEMTLLASRNATQADFERVMDAIRAGAVAVDRLITQRTSLSDAVREMPRWVTEKAGLIKALIEID
jgi:2-desacetyl-2-hydroxyethyl bacteriochlorophyllide A dehydrogenase